MLSANVRVDNFAAADLHVNLCPMRVILSEAESKEPAKLPSVLMGFLDFARNDCNECGQ
jgi:hypothetical protein